MRFFSMAESMVEASGTMQAPRVMGMEIMTMVFARDLAETASSSGEGGSGLIIRLWMII